MTGPRVEVLGAWLDAILASASEYDADDIANVIATRPRPSYEELSGSSMERCQRYGLPRR